MLSNLTTTTENFDSHLSNIILSSYDENDCVLRSDITLSTYFLPKGFENFSSSLPADGQISLKTKELLAAFNNNHVAAESGIQVRKLMACTTPGDGDCLLHAVALSMWGHDDKSKSLRRVFTLAFTGRYLAYYRQIWFDEERKFDSALGFNDCRSEEQLENEFNNLVSIAIESGSYLEGIHVSCLSNLLKRPIIVLGQNLFNNTDSTSCSGQPASGIYIPSLHPPAECSKRPLVLVFDTMQEISFGCRGHFIATVSAEDDVGGLPLTNINGKEHFPLRYYSSRILHNNSIVHPWMRRGIVYA